MAQRRRYSGSNGSIRDDNEDYDVKNSGRTHSDNFMSNEQALMNARPLMGNQYGGVFNPPETKVKPEPAKKTYILCRGCHRSFPTEYSLLDHLEEYECGKDLIEYLVYEEKKKRCRKCERKFEDIYPGVQDNKLVYLVAHIALCTAKKFRDYPSNSSDSDSDTDKPDVRFGERTSTHTNNQPSNQYQWQPNSPAVAQTFPSSEQCYSSSRVAPPAPGLRVAPQTNSETGHLGQTRNSNNTEHSPRVSTASQSRYNHREDFHDSDESRDRSFPSGSKTNSNPQYPYQKSHSGQSTYSYGSHYNDKGSESHRSSSGHPPRRDSSRETRYSRDSPDFSHSSASKSGYDREYYHSSHEGQSPDHFSRSHEDYSREPSTSERSTDKLPQPHSSRCSSPSPWQNTTVKVEDDCESVLTVNMPTAINTSCRPAQTHESVPKKDQKNKVQPLIDMVQLKCRKCAEHGEKTTSAEGKNHLQSGFSKIMCETCFKDLLRTGTEYEYHFIKHFVKKDPETVQCTYCDGQRNFDELREHASEVHLNLNSSHQNFEQAAPTETEQHQESLPNCSRSPSEILLPAAPGTSGNSQPIRVSKEYVYLNSLAVLNMPNELTSSKKNSTADPIEEVAYNCKRFFSPEEHEVLIDEFTPNPNPPWNEHSDRAAKKIGVNKITRVRDWFQRRYREIKRGTIPRWARDFIIFITKDKKLAMIKKGSADSAYLIAQMGLEKSGEEGRNPGGIGTPSTSSVKQPNAVNSVLDENADKESESHRIASKRKSKEKSGKKNLQENSTTNPSSKKIRKVNVNDSADEKRARQSDAISSAISDKNKRHSKAAEISAESKYKDKLSTKEFRSKQTQSKEDRTSKNNKTDSREMSSEDVSSVSPEKSKKLNGNSEFGEKSKTDDSRRKSYSKSLSRKTGHDERTEKHSSSSKRHREEDKAEHSCSKDIISKNRDHTSERAEKRRISTEKHLEKSQGSSGESKRVKSDAPSNATAHNNRLAEKIKATSPSVPTTENGNKNRQPGVSTAASNATNNQSPRISVAENSKNCANHTKSTAASPLQIGSPRNINNNNNSPSFTSPSASVGKPGSSFADKQKQLESSTTQSSSNAEHWADNSGNRSRVRISNVSNECNKPINSMKSPEPIQRGKNQPAANCSSVSNSKSQQQTNTAAHSSGRSNPQINNRDQYSSPIVKQYDNYVKNNSSYSTRCQPQVPVKMFSSNPALRENSHSSLMTQKEKANSQVNKGLSRNNSSSSGTATDFKSHVENGRVSASPKSKATLVLSDWRSRRDAMERITSQEMNTLYKKAKISCRNIQKTFSTFSILDQTVLNQQTDLLVNFVKRQIFFTDENKDLLEKVMTIMKRTEEFVLTEDVKSKNFVNDILTHWLPICIYAKKFRMKIHEAVDDFVESTIFKANTSHKPDLNVIKDLAERNHWD